MRVAGSNPEYTWCLWDDNTNKPAVPRVEIRLPSVTTIIKTVLAKPALVAWAYRQTRDVMTGVFGLIESGELSIEDAVDTFTDPDMAAEWFKDNRLRPDDYADDASSRGQAAHDYLERVARLQLKGGRDAALAFVVDRVDKTKDPYERGINDWWVDHDPHVVSTEERMYSLEHGFACQTDLVWETPAGLRVVTDLKTRASVDWDVYLSDEAQVGGQQIAHDERHERPSDHGTVLVVHETGEYKHREVRPNAGKVFLGLLTVYNEMKKGRG